VRELSAVFIATVNTKQTFTGFRALATWLGCYTYVIPADRIVDSKLPMLLYGYLVNKYDVRTATYLLSSYISILDSNVPLTFQHEIINYYETK